MSTGKLITIEGIDGSGKTTLINALRNTFPEFVYTREPYSISINDIIKNSSSYFESFLYFVTDHIYHLHREIQPALNENKTVICDRYIDSRAAYQGALLGSFSILDRIYNFHMSFSRIPDLTLFLKVDPEIAINRISHRNILDDFESIEFLRRVAENYDIICEKYRDRIIVIDANKNLNDVIKSACDIISNFVQKTNSE